MEAGHYQGNVAKKVLKKELNAMHKFPFIGVDKRGREIPHPSGKKAYSAPSSALFIPRKHIEAKRKVSITEGVYRYFISPELPPKFQNYKGEKLWKSWSQTNRLEWHLSQIAENNPFEYEVID